MVLVQNTHGGETSWKAMIQIFALKTDWKRSTGRIIRTGSITDLPSSQRPILRPEPGLISPSRMELSARRVQGGHFVGCVQLHEKPKDLDEVLGHWKVLTAYARPGIGLHMVWFSRGKLALGIGMLIGFPVDEHMF
jgi:hypothetical protein